MEPRPSLALEGASQRHEGFSHTACTRKQACNKTFIRQNKTDHGATGNGYALLRCPVACRVMESLRRETPNTALWYMAGRYRVRAQSSSSICSRARFLLRVPGWRNTINTAHESSWSSRARRSRRPPTRRARPRSSARRRPRRAAARARRRAAPSTCPQSRRGGRRAACRRVAGRVQQEVNARRAGEGEQRHLGRHAGRGVGVRARLGIGDEPETAPETPLPQSPFLCGGGERSAARRVEPRDSARSPEIARDRAASAHLGLGEVDGLGARLGGEGAKVLSACGRW